MFCLSMDFGYLTWITGFLCREGYYDQSVSLSTTQSQVPDLVLTFFLEIISKYGHTNNFCLAYLLKWDLTISLIRGWVWFFFLLNVGWPCDLLCPIKCGERNTIGPPTWHFKSFVASIFTFWKSSLLEHCLRPTGSEKAPTSSMERPSGGKLSTPAHSASSVSELEATQTV